MINDFDKRKLRYVVAPTRFYPQSLSHDMQAAYQSWKEIWSKAFNEEMNIEGPLYSDYFSRQSHVSMLFLGDEVVGLSTLNVLNLNRPQDLDDTYFKVFSPEILSDLRQKADLVMSCCNATIEKKFRKDQLGISALDLLFAMQILYLKSTPYQGITGTARLQRGVEKSCYRLGATPLARNIPYTIPGQSIDLICWYRDINPDTWDPHLREVCEFIWKRSTIIENISYPQGNKNAA